MYVVRRIFDGLGNRLVPGMQKEVVWCQQRPSKERGYMVKNGGKR